MSKTTFNIILAIVAVLVLVIINYVHELIPTETTVISVQEKKQVYSHAHRNTSFVITAENGEKYSLPYFIVALDDESKKMNKMTELIVEGGTYEITTKQTIYYPHPLVLATNTIKSPSTPN